MTGKFIISKNIFDPFMVFAPILSTTNFKSCLNSLTLHFLFVYKIDMFLKATSLLYIKSQPEDVVLMLLRFISKHPNDPLSG